ncbi:MAG TPA: rod shape-determining protein MreC [Candidatus Atribacteria bacterium]|nr:rod shape-determining protein MreC [Candidatus Atribacteria bacterium]
MRKFIYRNNPWLIFIILIIITLFIMTIDYHGKMYLKWLESIALGVFSPVSRGISLVTINVKNYLGSIAEFERMGEENKELKEKIESALHENAILKEKLIAYDRLKRLLELRESFSYEMIPSLVISREPGNWFNSIIIDKGRIDGVEENMAVATHYGLVGRVISVSSHTSKVLLILDQRSAVGSMIQRSRDIGVIKGTESNYCYMEYLSQDADVKINDIVITSGLGSIFPKGIKIGRVVVVKKEKHDLFQEVIIKPEVDFTKLEEVFVVKKIE